MRCPACHEIDKDKVIDSRLTEGGVAVRRRRECTSCKRRFTTKERLEEDIKLMVVKRDGNRAPFNRDKILAGVKHACYKLDVPDEVIEALADEVTERVFREYDREVSSTVIGQMVSRRLASLNHVAYVRFMSVFRKFRDVDEFIDEISEVRHRAAVEAPGQQDLF